MDSYDNGKMCPVFRSNPMLLANLSIIQVMKYDCCVFLPLNGCFPHCSLAEIIFFQHVYILFGQKIIINFK